MIDSIKVTNPLGESITMELGFPEKSGFLIRRIEGLGPSKATIGTTELSYVDGSVFNSSRVNSRNIVLTLGFLENPDIEATRLKSYQFFPIKKRIKMEVKTTTREAYTYGYIESNEPDIFSKEERAVISILCPEAYFYENNDLVTEFSTVVPVFEFPFSNESTTLKLLEFGDIAIQTSKNIYYTGDSPVGVVFNIHAIGSVNDLSILKVSTGETIAFSSASIIAITGADISAGDDIILSTVVGDKFARLIRSGITYNILNSIGQYPDWFQIERGDNLFTYSADTGVDNLQFTIVSKIAYEGV